MENNKIIVSASKLLIRLGVILCGIIALSMMLIHITDLPNSFTLLVRESILLVSAIVFYILAKRNKMKSSAKCAAAIIVISVFNLIGFNLIVLFILR